MEQILNLTPHAIDIYRDGEVIRTIYPTGLARCNSTEQSEEFIDGIPVIKVEYGDVTGLPEQQPGIYYIVSSITAQAAARSGRTDLLVPSKLVRDDWNAVIGCEIFCQL